jgi:hypothetical protein
MQSGVLDARMAEYTAKAKVIKIQNVADYHFNDMKDDYDLCNSFPNVAPPFEHTWFEYTIPREMRSSNGEVFNINNFQRRIGVFSLAFRVETELELKPWYEHAQKEGNAPFGKVCDRMILPGWMVNYAIFFHSRLDPQPHEMGAVWLAVNSDGRVTSEEGIPYRTAPGLMDVHGNKIDNLSIYWAMIGYMRPVLMALSFLHCKNVTLDGNDVPVRIQKRRMAEGKLPLVKYYTLNIEPMTRVLSREGGAEKNGAAKAMHICRGHFADYSKGNGLFGKYKGRYWIESHVRGSAELGTVVKDYNVIGSRITA